MERQIANVQSVAEMRKLIKELRELVSDYMGVEIDCTRMMDFIVGELFRRVGGGELEFKYDAVKRGDIYRVTCIASSGIILGHVNVSLSLFARCRKLFIDANGMFMYSDVKEILAKIEKEFGKRFGEYIGHVVVGVVL